MPSLEHSCLRRGSTFTVELCMEQDGNSIADHQGGGVKNEEAKHPAPLHSSMSLSARWNSSSIFPRNQHKSSSLHGAGCSIFRAVFWSRAMPPRW